MSKWQLGKQLQDGKYTIKDVLGQGGFGISYLVEDSKGRQFVIKTINETIQKHPDFAKICLDFYNEALRASRCCHHPHIVKITKVFEEEKLPCIVMEYIPGENLAARVKNQGPLSEDEALRYIRQIGKALTTVHNQELLHRDVKPQNIIIRADKREAVLIDFGTAREFNPDDLQTTRTAYLAGGYTPIEQYDSQSAQGPYTDIYALAGTLYYLLTQQLPIKAIKRQISLNSSKKDSLVSPKSLASHISDKVDKAIMKGLAFHTKNRPQTMEEFLQYLPPENIDTSPTVTSSEGITNITNNSHAKPQKKLSYFFFLAVVAFLSLGFILIVLFPLIIQEKDYSHYKNQDQCINIDYPMSWMYQEKKDIYGNFITFISPKESEVDSFQEKVNITIEDFKQTQPRSLNEYTNESIAEIRKYSDPNVPTPKDTTLANSPAKKIVYIGESDGHKVKKMQVWTVKNNKAYVITYTAQKEKYNKFQSQAEKMIRSFSVDKKFCRD